MSITVIVPAFNEERGLPATLEALLAQTTPADEIIVVDDCSTDATARVAASYGVTVLTPPANLGSKAKAQNYALPHCRTELVLPVDADTVLAPTYIELITRPFEDDRVAVAAGCVGTRFSRTPSERGRMIEYLYGFHWHRPIQNRAGAPVVCSGCCSAFRRSVLVEFGGFPERTIVEDMDFTWSQQIAGHRAVYVGDAQAWAADPENLHYLRKQVWRWMAGFFQNVRIHMGGLIRRKPMLALWVLLAVLEILAVPAWYATPFVWMFVFHGSVTTVLGWWLGVEVLILLPPLIYATVRRKLSPWHVAASLPFLYFVKLVNFAYAWKAMVVELALVPLGLARTLATYEKGR